MPFKVGALEIVVSDDDDDSVSSLVVDLRHHEVALVGCEVEDKGSDGDEKNRCGGILDGEKAKAVVAAAECSDSIRRVERSRDDDAVFILLVIDIGALLVFAVQDLVAISVDRSTSSSSSPRD